MRIFLLIPFCLIASFGMAQYTMQAGANAEIVSDINLSRLLDLHKQKSALTTEKKGYRIQIISDSNRANVYNKKAQVYQNFSEFKSYLKYDQPYYKLRIGDFETRLEARRYLERIVRTFPSAFIVIDDIKIR